MPPAAITADQFRAWRVRLGLTQSGAAAELGVTMRQVNNWENDRSPVDRRTWLAMQQLETTARADGAA